MLYFKLTTAIALLLCLAPMPYSYYVLVRIATIITFGILTYEYDKRGQEKMTWICIIVVLFFQPFIMIPFGRLLWNFINIASAIIICLNLWNIKKNEE